MPQFDIVNRKSFRSSGTTRGRGLFSMIGMILSTTIIVVGVLFCSCSFVHAKETTDASSKQTNVWIFTQPLFYDQFKPLIDHLLMNEDQKTIVTLLTPFDASDSFEQFLPNSRSKIKQAANQQHQFNLVKCPTFDTKIPADFYSSIVEVAGKKQSYFEYASYLKHQWIDIYFGKSFFKCGSSQLEKSKAPDVVVADCHSHGAFDFASSFEKPLIILCPTLAGLSTLQPVSYQTGKELLEPRFNPFNQVAYLKLFNQMQTRVETTSSFAPILNYVSSGQFSKKNSTDFIRSMNQENFVGQALNTLVNFFTPTQYHAFWIYELFLNNRRGEYLPVNIVDETSILDITKNAHVFYTSIHGVTEDSSLQIPSNAHLIPPLLNIKQIKWVNIAEKRLSEVKLLEKKMENRKVILVNLRDSFKLLPVFLNNLEIVATKHDHLVIVNKQNINKEIISKYPSFVFSDLRSEERNRILKSNSIRFVITSGDLLSTSEAIANNKPLLMVPSTTEGFAVSLQLSGNLKIGNVLIPSFTNDKIVQDVLSNYFRNTEIFAQTKITKQYSEQFSEGSSMSVHILSSYIHSLANTKTFLNSATTSKSFDTKVALVIDVSVVAVCVLLTLLIIFYLSIRILVQVITLLFKCCTCFSSESSKKKYNKEKTE